VRLPTAALLIALVVGTAVSWAVDTSIPADDPRVTRWEEDVAALEALDRGPPPAGEILFIGSSSVRLWTTIADDMAPWPAVGRGYGGARYRDLCHFVPRLVVNHDPTAIVVFVANDLAAPAEGQHVETVMIDVRATHARIRERHPRVPLLFVAVTPTESRWSMWPEIQRLNAAIEDLCEAHDDTVFVATAEHFLDPATGRPDPALFRPDRLHLSPAGYDVWAKVIAAALDHAVGRVGAATAVP
jgi:lysophospholipase L1-like esterase